MPGSTISSFGEPDDYQAALGGDNEFDLLVTEGGEFRAQLTRIILPRIQLLAGEENLARVAFIKPPPRSLRVTLPIQNGLAFYDGFPFRADELITIGDGGSLHERTEGGYEWRVIMTSVNDVMMAGKAIVGPDFVLPAGAFRWRPSLKSLRSLATLYDSGIRTNKAMPRVSAGVEATRGLEQQLLHVLVECMSADRVASGLPRQQIQLMRRFEEVIRADPTCSIESLYRSLHVPDRTLRALCNAHLGMSPRKFLLLHRLQLVRRALRDPSLGAVSVSEIARRYGFRQLGRFAARYQEQFGTLPSATLREKNERSYSDARY